MFVWFFCDSSREAGSCFTFAMEGKDLKSDRWHQWSYYLRLVIGFFRVFSVLLVAISIWRCGDFFLKRIFSAAVIRLKYCRYGVEHYPINQLQSINQPFQNLSFLFNHYKALGCTVVCIEWHWMAALDGG